MKILIAEDSEQKILDLLELLNELGGSSFSITIKNSFKDTINAIINQSFDIVFLDMSLPTKSTQRKSKKRTLAGKDILSTARFHGITSCKYIIFSQFSEFGRNDDVVSLSDIHKSLSDEYGDAVIGYVKYDSASEIWKNQISRILKDLK